MGRRKNGRVKPDINNVHYWSKVMLFREEESVWSFEKLFGESFSNGNERKSLDVKTERRNVYREVDKV